MAKYTVRSGESAGSLYKREYGDYAAFVKAIGKIRPGQVINLPDRPLGAFAPTIGASKVRAAPVASSGPVVLPSTTPTSSGILKGIAPTIEPLLGAIGAFQNLAQGMTQYSVNPPTIPQILQPLLAGAQRGLGDINRFFDPARQSLGIGQASGASKARASLVPQQRAPLVSFTAGVGPGQAQPFGGSQAAQSAYAQRYAGLAAQPTIPKVSQRSTGGGVNIGGAGGPAITSGTLAGAQADAARYTGQALFGGYNRRTQSNFAGAFDAQGRLVNPQLLPTLLSPGVAAAMGLNEEQRVALGYNPFYPYNKLQAAGGGGGGGGRGRARGGGGGGSAFGIGAYEWRV